VRLGFRSADWLVYSVVGKFTQIWFSTPYAVRSLFGTDGRTGKNRNVAIWTGAQ